MAQGLRLTNAGGRCGDTGDATSDALEALTGETRLGKTRTAV